MDRIVVTAAAGSSAREESLYAIKPILTKGYGMVAVTDIPKGTRILSESPLFTFQSEPDLQKVERTILEKLRLLGREEQRAFFALHNAHVGRHSPPFGIARTNALPLGPNTRQKGLFLEASRINHACRNNAQNTWNGSLEKITIHAIRDIKEGEEITIIYTGPFETYMERQTSLIDNMSFNCDCELCSLPLPQRHESNSRLRRLKYLDGWMDELQYTESQPQLRMQIIYEMIRLFEAEDICNIRLAKPYSDAFETAAENGDETRAKVFAEKVYAIRKAVEGDDSPSAIKWKGLAEQPTRSSLFVESGGSSHDVDQPPEPQSQEFEDWLWMKHEWSNIADTPEADESPEDLGQDSWTSVFQKLGVMQIRDDDEGSFDSLSTTAIRDTLESLF